MIENPAALTFRGLQFLYGAVSTNLLLGNPLGRMVQAARTIAPTMDQGLNNILSNPDSLEQAKNTVVINMSNPIAETAVFMSQLTHLSPEICTAIIIGGPILLAQVLHAKALARNYKISKY